MLEEAADLEKSWNKDATDFKGTSLNQTRLFARININLV